MSRIRTLVATEVWLVLGLLGFVGAAYVVERVAGLDGPVTLAPITAIVLSAIPALLWLSYFHAQDRHEPEPKHYVLGVYLIGAFFAGPLAGFLSESVLPGGEAHQSFGQLTAERLLWTFVLVGMVQELSKYVAVRYTIYLSPEFDEPMDGIIYMTAAGIGFATYENYHYLQGLEGTVFLSFGAANAVVTTLAHACFAGVLGYALGRARFSHAAPLVRGAGLFAGLLIAAVLNAQFYLLEQEVKTAGLEIEPWRGLMYAAGFAAIVFFIMSFLIRRHLAISPHLASESEVAP